MHFVVMISKRMPQHMSGILQESIRRRIQPNHERNQESAIKCIKSRAQQLLQGVRGVEGVQHWSV
jgi:hypothetical protein